MNSKIALILLSTLGAVAALPAIAPAAMALDRHETRGTWDADATLSRLQARGINASSVEQWNGLVRAFVEVDGRQVMQYFDADTIAPVEV